MPYDRLFERDLIMGANSRKRRLESAANSERSRARSAYPLGAVILSVAGAFLIILEGIYLLSTGVLSPNNDFLPSGVLIPSFQILAAIALLEGAIVFGLALMVYVWPGSHRFVGVASLTLALLSLFAGGGFLVGAMLVYVGGILAIYHDSEEAPSAGAGFPTEDRDDVSAIGTQILGRETTSSDVLANVK